MEGQFSRTERLLGKENIDFLKNARVAVFGVGGVGGFTVEGLVRSGVGTIDVIDDDDVCVSNLNRQIIATIDTIGMNKVDVAEMRCKQINPDVVINKHQTFFLPETADKFDFKEYDYVVDAIDTVAGKIQLVMCAKEAGVPIISAMGAGNKLDPTLFEVADISKTSVCPLAKTMRRELKKRGINKLKVVYSKEKAMTPIEYEKIEENSTHSARRATPGSVSFVPSVAGLIIAGEVIKDLCNPQFMAERKQ